MAVSLLKMWHLKNVEVSIEKIGDEYLMWAPVSCVHLATIALNLSPCAKTGLAEVQREGVLMVGRGELADRKNESCPPRFQEATPPRFSFSLLHILLWTDRIAYAHSLLETSSSIHLPVPHCIAARHCGHAIFPPEIHRNG